MRYLKNRKDYDRACAIAKSVIDSWDPYRLLEDGAPDDEFEAEAASIVVHLPRILSAEDAVDAVSTVFSNAFEPDLFKPEHCRDVGERIYRYHLRPLHPRA